MLDFSANPLIEADWLAANLDQVNLRIVDARWRGDGSARQRYLEGHIPGAVFLDWELDLSSTQNDIRFMLLPPNEFAAVMSNAGIGNDTCVVAYADLDYSGATRLWWALRYYGHSQVAVLNGGLNKWLMENHAIEQIVPSPPPARFKPDPQPQLIAQITEVEMATHRSSNAVNLVDTRPIEQFEGRAVWAPTGSLFLPAGQDWVEVEGRRMRAGHMPNAVHLNSSKNLDPNTWTYLDSNDIRNRAVAAGVDPENRVITYCGCGISASLGLFALHLAGYKNLALFDGSWEEWGTDPKKPIVK
jgi:thiosulfate/3-mercaptopyruvate sulfurtransferase